MKKTVWALILALCLLLSATGFAETAGETAQPETAEPETFESEKTVTLHYESGEAVEVTLRFFEETPNVPYMGLHEFWTLVVKDPVTVEKNEDGTLTLKNSRGGELQCDAGAGTMTSPNWALVVSPSYPLEGAAHGLKDSNCAFVRITEVTYEGDPAPVTFDFAKYGMRIYADDTDVYLPLSILSNMTTDIATNHLRYDWKDLYQQRISLEPAKDDPILVNDRMKAWLTGEERPADLISQCYADLCFNFDYFFGHPGVATLDAAMAEKGLDEALADLGEDGAEIKKGLLSPKMTEYISAMQKLFAIGLADGHTVAYDLSELVVNPFVAENKKLSAELAIDYYANLVRNRVSMSSILHMAVMPQRMLAWGDKTYIESGNTAIIRLDSFMPDEAAWDAWYKGEGSFPEDCIGSVVTGLRRAKENLNIKNVILDLSCNSGGSSDVLMALLAVTTGQHQLYGFNRITGQKMLVSFEADSNFDGVFDEKDSEARFDFNYGVLTTRLAFSCGNLFPFVMQEGGAVILGEPTSGGSCCIQIGTESQGIRYIMSSAQWQVVDFAGNSVEGGCPVDIPIKTWSVGLLDKLVNKLGFDEELPVYNAYFDEESLDTLMNTWFHEEKELAPAA